MARAMSESLADGVMGVTGEYVLPFARRRKSQRVVSTKTGNPHEALQKFHHSTRPPPFIILVFPSQRRSHLTTPWKLARDLLNHGHILPTVSRPPGNLTNPRSLPNTVSSFIRSARAQFLQARIVNGEGEEKTLHSSTHTQREGVRDHEKPQEPPNRLCAVLGRVWIGAGEEDKHGDGPGWWSQLQEGRERRREPSPEAPDPVPLRPATPLLITTPCVILVPLFGSGPALPFFLEFFENFAREKKYGMKRPSGSRSGGVGGLLSSDDGFVGVAVEEEAADEDMVMPGGGGEKKRRLSTEQVRALERSFETENKLEPERKARLARDLGLQPRQVAVWFQNRRARWKTKQLERDYVALRRSYDALRADHDALRHDNDALLAEIKELKAKLGDEDVAASFSSVKEEPVASDVEPPAAATAVQGSSESDSSGVVNDAETAPEKATPTAAEADAEAVVPGAAAALHGEVFFHGQLLKVEDDEAAFLGDDDAACGGFFADLQPPSLPWWTEPMEHWA